MYIDNKLFIITMAEQKRIPISRKRFFGSEDFNLEQSMGMEWLHGDMNYLLVVIIGWTVKCTIWY